MAYDRYDTRGDRARWSNDRFSDRDRFRDDDRRFAERGRDDRGFFERAGDEIASWFGDDEPRRRDRDDRDQDRGAWSSHGYRSRADSGGGFTGRSRPSDFGNAPGLERGSRPILGGYTAAEQLGDDGRGDNFYSGTSGRYERDLGRSRAMDPHYHSWRRRQMDEFDRDYEDYRQENQARFDDDFTNWRQRRGEKRGLLGQIREHMEVIGSDEQHVGTIDHIAGDRIILTKSDPESGGAHHSLSCSDIDRIDGDRVILDCSADKARERWRDESRSRALFEREDQGEMGPRVLDRSFEGTYR